MAVLIKSRLGKRRLLENGRAKADRAVRFINTLKHSTGQWAGKPFILMDWQEELIRRFYGTLNPDGTRQYRTVWLEVPRKNGKTELGAGGFALPLLYLDDELGAQIYSAANDREQAGLLFQAAAPMVEQNHTLNSLSKVYSPQKRIVYYRNRSFYVAISADRYNKDGLNAHAIIYDELHAAKTRELWDVLTTSHGTRTQPADIVTTTAGYDRNSICWELHNYACKVRDGIIDDPTWLVCIYAAEPKEDWTDEDVWLKCNPALGVFRSIEEMRSLCKRAQQTPALEMTFRRLYLDQWVNSAERWMRIETWDACNKRLPKLAGLKCYGGLDLSSTKDLTALALVFHIGDKYAVKMHYWIPEATMLQKEKEDRVPYSLWKRQGHLHVTDGNVVDYDYMREITRQEATKYEIAEVAFDRWNATQIVTQLMDDGFNMTPFGQGFVSMSPATKDFETQVLSGNLIHGNNPILRWNIDNLVVRQDPAGNLKPDKEKSTQRIDGAVATIMGLSLAIKHADEDAPSIYETQGVTAL